MSKTKSGYIIHYVCNCLCPECKEFHVDYPDGLCNAHSHGLNKYHSLDFQVVLDDPDLVSYTLNTLAKKVQQGEIFAGGQLVTGLFKNNVTIKLEVFKEGDRNVLRVIYPDQHNRWPEDKNCAYPFNQQLLPTDQLLKKSA